MSPELKVLIGEARSILYMIRSDLDDLEADKATPDGDQDGLSAARGRTHDLLRQLTEIEAFAKRRGISLRPRFHYPPKTPFRGEDIF